MNKKVYIIGSGPAGLTAAIYTSRSMIDTYVVSGSQPGGQLITTTEVENFPGFPEGIMGPQLMIDMQKQAKRFGVNFIDGLVTEVDFTDKIKKLTIGGKVHSADAVIIATGSQTKYLGLPNEKDLVGKGVSTCATCDGFFFRDKKIAVIGGGDSALEEAVFLTKFASSVTIIHRRDSLRASKIMQKKALNNEKIDFLWDSAVVEILGDQKLEKIKIKNLKTEEISEFELDGMFVAIGHVPATQVFKGQIDLDKKGYISLKQGNLTNIEGVYAAGDVADPVYQQAISSAGDGCRAAIDVQHYLESLN